MATIAVFGLGYVGTVSAACFAERGHRIIGVDVAPSKVDLINEGRTPVYEDRIGELIRRGVQNERLRATTDAAQAVAEADAAIICVGTPSAPTGGLGLDAVETVVREIGRVIDRRTPRFEVIVRSTMLPGTTERTVIPLLEEASGLKAGDDFGVSVNPEFLREGTSVADFFAPPKTVIGALDQTSAAFVSALYDGLPGPVHVVAPAVAEMTKYADNSFHALKVAYANELGRLCKLIGIDSHELMDVFVSDTKLNISSAYLRPGFAFGGSCLPKDVRAVVHLSRHLDAHVPVLSAIIPSNDLHIDAVYQEILACGSPKVALYGLAFKVGTDDLRESPTVTLAERLLGRGFDLRVYDPQVQMSQIVGANRAYVQSRIPHLSRLIHDDVDELAGWADVHVLVNADDDVVAALARQPEPSDIIALGRPESARRLESRKGYRGVAW